MWGCHIYDFDDMGLVIWSGKVQYARRHQTAPMGVGIVPKLRRGFEDVGRKCVYNISTLLEDPIKGWPRMGKKSYVCPWLHFYYKAGCSWAC